jgi:hypothetical protein
MKRLLVMLAMVAALALAVYGAAAALNVDGGFVQAGSDTSVSCDDGVGVWYNFGWQNNQIVVDQVSVGGIDQACLPAKVFVVLTDQSGNSLWQGTGTATAPSGAVGISVSPGVPADQIYDVHVGITKQ